MKLKNSRKKAAMVVLISVFLAILLAVADGKNEDTGYMERQEPGEGSQEKEYVLEAEGIFKEDSWIVTAEEQKFTEEEKSQVFKKAQKELEQQIIGENKSLEEVNKDLYLPDTLQEGTVKVEYTFSDYKIFYPDGTVRELPKQAAIVTISAEMNCQEDIFIYEFAVQAVPGEENAEELLKSKIREALKVENEKTGEEQLTLPTEVDGVKLLWKESTDSRSMPVFLLGIAAAVCILASEKEAEKKQQKERQKQLRADYPEILGKLILLMGAGMSLSLAWKRITEAYRRGREEGKIKSKPAYEEMLTTVYEMQEGIGEIQAYKNFGERCAVPEYRKLAAMLVQNLRKGSTQIQGILEDEKIEAYEKQKARIKTAGEEAGTKLLFPMLLMLLVVLIIIMVPAGMSMNL